MMSWRSKKGRGVGEGHNVSLPLNITERSMKFAMWKRGKLARIECSRNRIS
jgi:hypothetical protein